MIVRPIPAAQAAQALAAMAHLDPRGLATPADVAQACQDCEALEVLDGQGGRAVVLVAKANGMHWIEAAAGEGGANLCATITEALDASGARSIGFQTKRRGLVRRAERLGYRVCGYIMRRDT